MLNLKFNMREFTDLCLILRDTTLRAVYEVLKFLLSLNALV